MADEAAIRAAFAQQAIWCRSLGSPFTALLMQHASSGLDRTSAVGRRILDWPGNPDAAHDSVPLRFAGGLNALVRAGRLPLLAPFYPPAPLPDGPALWQAVAGVLARDGDRLDPWLDNAPQTNEVARSAALMCGLLTIADATGGLPFAVYEVGSSAGLNLRLDSYSYRLGALDAGLRASSVHFEPEWTGSSPPAAKVQIVRRRAVDLRPADVTREADRQRLLAYIWPDQRERLARIASAIALAAEDPPAIDTGDAADWLERQLDPAPEPGLTRVLMHSIAFQYFPEATKQRIAAHASAVGAEARHDAPFAWLRFEGEAPPASGTGLRVTLWPGGQDRLLATGSPHGLRIEWRA